MGLKRMGLGSEDEVGSKHTLRRCRSRMGKHSFTAIHKGALTDHLGLPLVTALYLPLLLLEPDIADPRRPR